MVNSFEVRMWTVLQIMYKKNNKIHKSQKPDWKEKINKFTFLRVESIEPENTNSLSFWNIE